MKMKRISRITAIVVALMMLATMSHVSQSSGTVYADSGDSAITKGGSALEKGVNTDGLQRIWYGGETWLVVGYDGGGSRAARSGVITVLHETATEATAFNADEQRGNAYGGSDLRTYIESWLYGGSRAKFTAGEQDAMAVRTLEGGTPTDPNAEGFDNNKIIGDSVDALLWPISAPEAESMPEKVRKIEGVYWWLRGPSKYTSPYYLDTGIGAVSETGNYNQSWRVTSSGTRVRPAFDLDMNSVVLTSAATGGKPAADSGNPLKAPGSNNNDEWKLTVADSAHNGFAITPVSLDNGIMKINYSGAVKGNNEYISALITRSNGSVKYYGKVQTVSSASGTVSVNISGKWDLDAGDRLYIFNEQCNGDNETDYASTLKEIDANQFYFAGVGTADKPYTINSQTKWNALADYVAKGENTTGMYIRLDEDIAVNRMIGTEEHPFSGNFDGNGHTLDFSVSNFSERTAPFAYVRGATIRNLQVTGSITGNKSRASGLIGENSGSTTVTNCRVSATISGGKLLGGFCIGAGSGTGDALNITGCVFDGKITGSNECGGFVAWGTSGLSITNSVFAPQSGTTYSGGTFCHEGGGTPTLTNCLYREAVGTAQGKQALSVTGADGVTVDGKKGTAYNVSDITAYSKGLTYGNVLYAGAGDTVSLTLTVPESDIKRFVASAGVLTGSGTSYNLVMPEETVIISTEWTKLPAPQDVQWKISETDGLLDKSNSMRATWSASQGATGYYLTPGIVENGAFKPLGDALDVNPTVYEGKASYNLTSSTLENSGKSSGYFAFTIQAHNEEGLTSDVVQSDATEVYRLNLNIFGSPVLYVRKGADIAGCLTRYFSNGPTTVVYITEDGNYYYKDWGVSGGADVQVLAFMTKPTQKYGSLTELMADALLVPNGSSSSAKVTGEMNIYVLTGDSLCTDGALHSFELVEAGEFASIYESGKATYLCSKCGRTETRTIPQLKEIKTAAASYTYTGKAIKPAVVVKDADGTVVPASEYSVTYKNNVNAGTGTASINFEGSKLYTGYATASFKINPASVSKITFPSVASKVYTGKQIKPTFTAKYNGISLKSSNTAAFKITYGTNKNVGKGTIKIIGKGNYTGTKTLTFRINPKGTSLKTLTKASKAITVKWNKQSAKMSTSPITGYQIQVATDKKFTKNKKTVTVKGYSKTQTKISKLKGNTNYYVRIRTYKTVSGVNYYSGWSGVKTIKTKN